jgi:hypothetical protein
LASLALRQLPSALAAGCLVVLGLAGMTRLSTPATARLASIADLEDDTRPVSLVLEERESTLHRRRDSEVLLAQFVSGQMTRHYWGHFAGSLADLGLEAGQDLQARVESGPGFSRLWLTPRRGGEVFMAEVRLRGDRLERMQCRGSLPRPTTMAASGCPAGWQAFGATQPS